MKDHWNCSSGIASYCCLSYSEVVVPASVRSVATSGVEFAGLPLSLEDQLHEIKLTVWLFGLYGAIQLMFCKDSFECHLTT